MVGAAKSGTTAFASALRAHPDVFLPAVKEPHYYAYLADPLSARKVYADEAEAHRRYHDLYADVGDEAAVGDASTTSLVVPGAAAAIARDVPDALIVVVLRHPVDRAFSNWCHFVAAGGETLDFAEAVRVEPERQALGVAFTYQYLGWGRYAGQLRPFFELFGHNRVLVHLHDDLVADGEAVMRSTFRFLGVDDTVPRPPVARENEVRAVRFRSVTGRPGRLVRRATPDRWRNQPKPRLDPALRARLTKDEFAGEIDQLEELLGRDLSAWR